MSLNNSNHQKQNRDYQDKSNRISAWSEFIRSFSKFAWLIVAIIVLVTLGKIFLSKSDKSTLERKPITKPVVQRVDWSKVNKAIAKTMTEARLSTEQMAAGKLDLWIADTMIRVDNDFLDWYFGYWTQQKLGLKSLLAQVWHWVDSDSPTPAEKLTMEVQEEFTNRVIRPQIAQLEIERIIAEIVAHYSATLKDKLALIPVEYKITPAEWDRYIGDMAVMIKSVDANRGTPLTLKAIVGLTAGGTIMVVSTLRPMITRIGARISSRMAAKTAAKMAAKTGGNVAAKTGGRFLGPIIAIGIIIWDVWDHYSTKAKAKPILRQNIHDYLNEVKQSLLHDPSYGIMTIIYQMEQGISSEVKTQDTGV